MAEEDAITKALKHIEGELMVYIRGGKIVKILAQERERPLKDGIIIIHKIPADII